MWTARQKNTQLIGNNQKEQSQSSKYHVAFSDMISHFFHLHINVLIILTKNQKIK
jgi:hypothetical protein